MIPRAKRRRFTAKYKLRILEEADRCDQPGQIGVVLAGSSQSQCRKFANQARPFWLVTVEQARPLADDVWQANKWVIRINHSQFDVYDTSLSALSDHRSASPERPT